MEMETLIKQANLTPALAREIKQLLDDFEANHPIDETEYYFIVRRIVDKDDERKRFAKEAKNPEKALDDERKQEQHDEMEDDRNEAKRDARESGESWSDIKDEWEDEWLQDNWDDDRERLFLDGFKRDWQRGHGREFPNSDFAPKNTGKAA